MLYGKSLWMNVVIAVLTVLALAGCKRERQIVIGVSQCSEDIWRDKLIEELLLSSYRHDGVSLRILSAKDDDRQQISQINRLMDEGIDLLIVSPNQLHKITPIINKVYDSGIPVILFDRKTDSQKYTAFIGADNVEAGRMMGEYIARRLDGKGDVAEISGLRTSSPSEDRHRGFMAAMKKYPGIRVVEQRYADWTEVEGASAMDSLLARHTKIDFVFSQNDRMASGAMQTARRAGRSDIRFTGIDALPVPDGGLEQVARGDLDATYIYPTRGDLVFQLAMDILGGKYFKRENYLQGAVVTQDDARLLLMQNDEFTKQRERLYELHAQVNSYLSQYSHQKVYLVLLIVIVVLLIGLTVFIYHSVISKHRLKEEAVAAKLQFFTNVSHEFRTPLTLIADPIDRLLADSALPKESRQMLTLVRRNVQVMLRLVGEILDFRKVQNGKMKVLVTETDIADDIREWAASFAPATAPRHIALNLHVPDSLPVVTDRNKVERIVYNLLSNALKYSPDRSEITVELARGENDTFVLSVADTGKGIARENLAHVFERFYQVKQSSTGGTGIGLALVKAYVELMGGRIGVESEEGKCTKFTVVLPVTVAGQAAEDTAEPETTAAPDEPSLMKAVTAKAATSPDDKADERPMVLVVDDNEDIRAYMAALLADDYEVKCAANGTQGIDAATAGVPDIVVSDVMMPDMDGMEMCRLLKAQTATSHIPVILLTALSQDDRRMEGYDCGADAYVTKPFNSAVLLSRIKNLLASRQQLRTLFGGGKATEAEAEAKVENADTAFVDDFRSIVARHISDAELSVETISAEMGLSRVQMYRKVKALTGMSPVELVRTMRLRRAEKLLKAGGRTVAEVAYEVGFSTPSYFTKCYKDYFGKTPTAG